jgi:nitrite reductase/ring-hydroxylating ferredoxin subunit
MRIFAALSVIMMIFFTSCGKEQSLIPDVPVNLNIPVNDPRINGLTTVAGKVIILEGHGIAGLILYSRLSDKVLVAYDRCSTVNPEKKNKLDLLAGSIVEDKVSGAQFNLEDGSAVKAPATRSLKRYSVSINAGTISVYN